MVPAGFHHRPSDTHYHWTYETIGDWLMKLWVIGYGPAFQCDGCGQFFAADEMVVIGRYLNVTENGVTTKERIGLEVCPKCVNPGWERIRELVEERKSNV